MPLRHTSLLNVLSSSKILQHMYIDAIDTVKCQIIKITFTETLKGIVQDKYHAQLSQMVGVGFLILIAILSVQP